MLSATELLTVAISGAVVVGASIGATVYMAGYEGGAQDRGASTSRGAYELSDAFFTCRDKVSQAIPYKIRNLNVDSRSSRFDADDKALVVFLDLEVIERPGAFYSKHNYAAKVTCSVSSETNQVLGFNVRKV